MTIVITHRRSEMADRLEREPKTLWRGKSSCQQQISFHFAFNYENSFQHQRDHRGGEGKKKVEGFPEAEAGGVSLTWCLHKPQTSYGQTCEMGSRRHMFGCHYRFLGLVIVEKSRNYREQKAKKFILPVWGTKGKAKRAREPSPLRAQGSRKET